MKKELGKIIANELRSLRIIHDKTVEEVAKSTKLNKDTIYRYEKDSSSIKLYILNKLLSYYELDFFIFITKIYDRLQSKPIS